MIRIATAAALVAVGALVPLSAAAKPEYTVTCSANAHDVTLSWPGGTDLSATTARLLWPDGSEEPVTLVLPKQGGVHTYTWHDIGTQTGPLLGVEVQFLRNNNYFPPPLGVFCLQEA